MNDDMKDKCGYKAPEQIAHLVADDNEKIRSELAIAMGWTIEERPPGSASATWIMPNGYQEGHPPDPLNNDQDLASLEAWAWEHHTLLVHPAYCSNPDLAYQLVMPVFSVWSDASGKELLRAKREAAVKAIHAAVTKKELGDG